MGINSNVSHPEIVLVGVDRKPAEFLTAHFSNKFRFILLENNLYPLIIDEELRSYNNIFLFIIDADKRWMNTIGLVPKLKKIKKYENIPILGVISKRHFHSYDIKEKMLFDDIITFPCNYEDLLTRLEIWARSYELLKEDDISAQSEVIKPLKA